MTQVSDVMTRGIRTLAPGDSIAAAAQAMEELDVGVVPVCDGERLVGMVTDRDIVVRADAKGRPADATPLEEVMSRDLRWCFDDQPVDDVLEEMRDARIRRVPVLDRAQHLVGMLSLGDVALRADGEGAAIVLQEVSEPGAPDAGDAAAGEPGESGEAQAGWAGDSGAPARAESDDIQAPGESDEGADADVRSDDGRWANRGVVPMQGNRTTWVLVADEALARILRWPEEGDELEDVEAITDPAAHAREGDFHRDAAGRRAGVAPQGSRQNTPQHRLRGTSSVTASAGEGDLHLEAQGFARRVAQHLAEALRQKRFDELRIVAAPRFLGYLRKELDAHVKATVSDELSKDLIHEGRSALSKRLFGAERGQ